MKNNLNTTLSTLLNTFELINTTFKDKANPLLIDYTVTEMHCIERIGKIQNPNVTKLSHELHLTRGGISKLVKKLIKKNAIEAYSSDDNKKEIYYKLTESGMEIFEAHEKLHKKWNNKDKEFFKQFNKEEVEFAINFIQKYTDHLKRTLTNFNWSD